VQFDGGAAIFKDLQTNNTLSKPDTDPSRQVVTETKDRFCTESLAVPLQANLPYFLIHLTIGNMYIYTVYTNLLFD
jgi:glyoxylate carboligase